MLAYTVGAVPGGAVPPFAAGHAICSAIALPSSAFGRWREEIEDSVVVFRSELCGKGHPLSEMGFEGFLIVVAISKRFTSRLDHDIGAHIRREESGGRCVQHAVDTVEPDFVLSLQSARVS